MSVLSRLRSILPGAIRRTRAESEMDEEIRDHMARYTDDLVRSGVDPAEAARRAKLEFGHIEPLKEHCRQARGWRYLDETSQDLRYAARMFRKNPGFAAVAILTLALGIGANTSIFTIVDAWILKPLPYPHGERLMVVHSTDERRKAMGSSAPADFYDWQSRLTAFDEFAAWDTPLVNLTGTGDPEQLSGVRVTHNFLALFGAGVELGRTFSADDDRPGAERVAILSHELWDLRFSSDPSVAGRVVRLDGKPYTIVGVLAPGFHLPLTGMAQVWIPFAMEAKDRAERRSRYLSVAARLKPGVTRAAANAELKAVAASLAAAYPDTNASRSVRVGALREEIARLGTHDAALMVFALVGCVLLIACFNVANLVVGRAIGRQKEMAVRLGLGAGRMRIMRQLLTENLALFVAAGAVSVLFSMWGVRWISNAIPSEVRPYLPYNGRLSVDVSALLYTFEIALAAGALFGFAPALHCWRLDVNHGLKAGAARAGGSRLKSALVIGEVALALVVLVSSGLLVRGLVRMHRSDPGFDTSKLTTATIVLSDSRYTDFNRAGAFYSEILERLSTSVGVRAAAAATLIPYTGNSSMTRYASNDADLSPAAPLRVVRFNIVAGDFIGALRIPLLRGRAFTAQDRDGASTVGIVNQAFAQREWPGLDPIGRRVHYGPTLKREFAVVGVVRNIEGQNETDRIEPEIFLPYLQLPVRAMTLLVRYDSADPGAAVRQAVRAVDPAQAVAKMSSMNQLMTSQRAQFVITGQVTGCFAALSLFLAGLGIYAVMAYSVATRRREFGIRMALGASGGDVISAVIRQGFRLAGVGLAIGLAAAIGVTRLMEFMLYHVSPTDFPTFASTSCLLAVASVFACYIPARRASRTDPSRALRYE